VPAAARDFWQQTLEQVPSAVKKRGPLVNRHPASRATAAFFSFFLLALALQAAHRQLDLAITTTHVRRLYATLEEFPWPSGYPGKYLAAHASLATTCFCPSNALVPRPRRCSSFSSSDWWQRGAAVSVRSGATSPTGAPPP